MSWDTVNNEYFEWLCDIVCGHRYPSQISYRKLLMSLHNKEFRYTILRDENRAEDGIDLRHRFECDSDYDDATSYLQGPCSVLEMMIGLAIHCEEDTMDDPSIGDRTAQWFWGMVVNLGLGSMNDNRFDRDTVEDILERFLDREYEPNGKGGLFTIRGCDRDLRTVEIWHQLCWYLGSIT